MIIYILTLFPELFNNFINFGSVKKAININILKLEFINIKENNKQKIDDYQYGDKKSGMVIKCEPLFKALCKAISKIKSTKYKIIYVSPQGVLLNNNIIKLLLNEKNLIIICGRYEGIDERINQLFVDHEISIGNYVLNGGELPSMVIIELISRFLPGVIKNINSIKNESFNNNLLDYPKYTRPKIFMCKKVPDVLLSGNKKKINEWKINESKKNTYKKRIDLILLNKINKV